jgi:hypothetical protein
MVGNAKVTQWIDAKLEYQSGDVSTSTPEEIPDETEKAIEEILDRKDFRDRVKEEASRIYHKEQAEYFKMKAEEEEKRLLDLQSKGFNAPAKLQSYLKRKGSPLADHAEDITKLPRWIEAIAIAGHETQFCKTGVGGSQNNCGGMKARSGGFVHYKNSFEGLKAISDWLVKNPKEVSSYNGYYCVHEEAGGGPCPNWTENIETIIGELLVA